jgi:hypothetical protein
MGHAHAGVMHVACMHRVPPSSTPHRARVDLPLPGCPFISTSTGGPAPSGSGPCMHPRTTCSLSHGQHELQAAPYKCGHASTPIRDVSACGTRTSPRAPMVGPPNLGESLLLRLTRSHRRSSERSGRPILPHWQAAPLLDGACMKEEGTPFALWLATTVSLCGSMLCGELTVYLRLSLSLSLVQPTHTQHDHDHTAPMRPVGRPSPIWTTAAWVHSRRMRTRR